MAQATPSQNIAVTPETHRTSPHQRPPTALGILGRFPPEVRNQLYRDVFHGVKAAFSLQWGQQQSLDRPKHSFGILTASKTMRTEAEPFFYRYCQFNFDVRFSQDRSHFSVAGETQSLQRKLLRMYNVALEAIPIHSDAILNGSLKDQVPFIPIEPHAPDDRGLAFPDIFEEDSFNGHEMVLHFIFNVESFWGNWHSFSNKAVQQVFIPFRRYEIVKVYVDIRLQESAISRGARLVRFTPIAQILQDQIVGILGPGTKTNALEQVEAFVYTDCAEYHPKSHFEAMAKGKGLESEAATKLDIETIF